MRENGKRGVGKMNKRVHTEAHDTHTYIHADSLKYIYIHITLSDRNTNARMHEVSHTHTRVQTRTHADAHE